MTKLMPVDVIVNFRLHFQGHKSHQGQKGRFHKFICLSVTAAEA